MRAVGIVGAGPAGLAAANALANAGVDFELIDGGQPLELRSHDKAEQLGVGVGGAGLFSDGKFSYFPSGTNLYALGNRARLEVAYDYIRTELAEVGIPMPAFPILSASKEMNGTPIKLKEYESRYGSLEQRRQFIQNLANHAAEVAPITRTWVDGIHPNGTGYVLSTADLATGARSERAFRNVILASGRFGGRQLSQMLGFGAAAAEQRYEVGFRIEHRNGSGFFKDASAADVKFIMHQDDVEIRTFCTCRHGEVWLIPYGSISALSGRSDGPPSEFSNFGLLARFSGSALDRGRAVFDHSLRTASSNVALWQPLTSFLRGDELLADESVAIGRPWFPSRRFTPGRLGEALGADLRRLLIGAVGTLLERFPDLESRETMCIFPALEGAGAFPNSDSCLQVPGERIWCCGDVVGRFRGLVPALVSGYYAGRAVVDRTLREVSGGIEDSVFACDRRH